MKLGIFGDSFADKYATKNIWWKYLNSTYGHDVTCFGEPGASLLFSAQQIFSHFHNYDLNIWCLTSPFRFTLRHLDEIIHITNRHHKIHENFAVNSKIELVENFYNKVVDIDDCEFEGHCITEFLIAKVPNLLIIPTFATRFHGKDFNLFELCTKETAFYFENPDVAAIYDQYNDLRAGHLTDNTHIKLAQLINNSLIPGVFFANYSDFTDPIEPFNACFEPK